MNVSPENYMEGHSIDLLQIDPDSILLSIQNVLYETDLLERILTYFDEEDVNVDVLTQTAPDWQRSDYAFIIDGSDYEVAQRIAERVTASDPHYIAKADKNITRLSLTGIGMRTQSGVAAKFFQVLADAEVPVRMITTSEIRIAVVIADEYVPQAVRAVKAAFDL